MIFNLLFRPGWLDYNHLYVFGKSLHQQEYKVLRKGIDAGLRSRFPFCLVVKERYVQRVYHLLQPLKNLAVYVMERYEPYTKEFVTVGQLLPRHAE